MSMFRLRSAVFALILLSPAAQAYDEDTHFYSTYAMARFAGIKHEYAQKIATAAQWMDESYISDPTSMIFLPVTGVRKRRLLHFPSAREGGQLSSAAQAKILNIPTNDLVKSIADKVIKGTGYEGDLNNLVMVSNTVENSEWASQLLIKGLKTGDLMMASASLHVLEDSFAHAGNPAGEGHFYEWHWPDRPFHDPAKYGRMVHVLFAALVAIRGQLPDDAIDSSPAPAKWAYNGKLGAQELADQYFALIKDTISYDILTDKTYVQTAIVDFYERAKKINYLNGDNLTPARLNAELNLLPLGSIDTYAGLKQILTHLSEEQSQPQGKTFLNMPVILKDMGKWDAESGITIPEYIASLGPDMDPDKPVDTKSQSFQNFVNDLVNQALLFQVPMPPSTTHVREMEDDTSMIRKTEMKIRDRNMRKFIYENFGINIFLVHNNTSDAQGMIKEVQLDKSAEPNFKRVQGATYATFSLAEKYRWDMMIFNYLFPDLKPDELKELVGIQVDIDDYLASRKRIQDEHHMWLEEKRQLLMLDVRLPGLTNRAVGALNSMKDRFLSDLVNGTRVEADSKFFENPYEFAKYKNAGRFKTLVWPVNEAQAAQRQAQP